ncbi:MAG: hypothetical protein ACTHN5_16190 [Phycisphaerae bacterium]
MKYPLAGGVACFCVGLTCLLPAASAAEGATANASVYPFASVQNVLNDYPQSCVPQNDCCALGPLSGKLE